MKIPSWRVWALGLLLAAALLGLFAAPTSREQAASRPVVDPLAAYAPDDLIGKERATARAAAYLGIEDLESVAVSVKGVIPRDDRTPFLHELINGRPCYLVTFAGLDIRIPIGEWISESEVHTLNALLDAETGQLLKVWSSEWLDPPSMRRTAEQVESNFRLMALLP